MAEIVGAFALSHSPFWDLRLPKSGPGLAFATRVLALRERVAALEADAVVLFGPDHFRSFFYDVMPAYCIGVEQLIGCGDYGRKAGPFPVAGDLGRAVHRYVSGAGFDPAISYKMGMDHGMSQPYELLFPDGGVPIVPIMINANAAPRPAMHRCYRFGQAVGAALRESAPGLRVALLASGGMSHWVQSLLPDDPALAPELRHYVISGRNEVAAYSARRDAGLAERARQGVAGRVNEEWDRWVLSLFAAGDPGPLCACPDDEIEARAGNGAHELRAWLAASGAWGGPMQAVAYEAVPRWVTGMGCIAGPASLAAAAP